MHSHEEGSGDEQEEEDDGPLEDEEIDEDEAEVRRGMNKSVIYSQICSAGLV